MGTCGIFTWNSCVAAILFAVVGGGNHHTNKPGTISVRDAQGILEAGGVGRLAELTSDSELAIVQLYRYFGYKQQYIPLYMLMYTRIYVVPVVSDLQSAHGGFGCSNRQSFLGPLTTHNLALILHRLAKCTKTHRFRRQLSKIFRGKMA